MRLLGNRKEAAARDYLEQQGLTLVEKNFSSRFGEIDLIMLEAQTLCFVEVRYRQSSQHGGAAASITPVKQRKIVKTAQFFLLQESHYHNYPMRFDTVLISDTGAGDDINWIRGAFYAQ